MVYTLQQMDGRQRGILRNQQGQFISRTQWLNGAKNEISEHMKKFEHYKKFVGENPDLKVLMDLEKAQIEAKKAEIRLVYHSKQGIDSRVKAYEEAMKKQGMKGKDLKEQVEKYRNSLKEERHKYFEKLKGKNNAKNIQIAQKSSQETGMFKSVGNFFSKIGKAIKGNKGKTALAAGVLAAIGGVVALTKNCENKPVSENTNLTDFATVVSPEKEAVKEQPPLTEQSENIHIVKDDESIWGIGKEYLESKNTMDYEPRNDELCNMREELMKINNLKYDNTRKKKNYFVNIYPNDTIKLKN